MCAMCCVSSTAAVAYLCHQSRCYVARCLSTSAMPRCAALKRACQAQLALLPHLSSLTSLVSSFLCCLLLLSCPHLVQASPLSLSPSPSKPLVLTLLHLACFLSGIPWQGPPKGPVFTFLSYSSLQCDYWHNTCNSSI